MVNEDVGDAAALRREVKRLKEELAAARASAASAASSTPARVQAAADALVGGPAVQGAAASQAARKALVGALRREDNAVKQVRRLEGQIKGMKELVQSLQQDVQRGQMMMKLKDSRLTRLQSGQGVCRPACAGARISVPHSTHHKVY